MSEKRTWIGWTLGVALAVLAVPGEVQAGDFGFSVGQDLGVVNVAGLESISNTGTRIGYRTGRFHLFGTADYARVRVTREFANVETEGGEGETQGADETFSLATLGVGSRFFFDEPQGVEKEVVPYAIGSAYTVIPSARDPDDESYTENSWSIGFQAGFGADYFFTDAFSIGGELGVDGLFGGMTSGEGDAQTTDTLSMWQVYSGVQFSFYL